RLYDLAAPGEPLAEAGQLSLGNQVYDLAFSADGRYLYAASGDLKVVDIAAPASPALVRTYTAGDFQRGGSFASNSRVLAHGDFLYVPGASNVGFIDVFDIRVPTAPVILGQHIFSTQDQDTGVMAASGNTLLALHTKATVLTVRPSGSDRVAWDGRDASGMVVAAGTYTVVVDALDAYGDAASTSTTVVVNPAYATPAVADAVAPVLSAPLAHADPFTPNLGELTFEYRADEAVNATVEIRNSSNQLVKAFPGRLANPGLVVASEDSTFTGPGAGKSVRLRGGYAYYSESDKLSVFDLRDPAHPARAAALQLSAENGGGEFVELAGSRLFVSVGSADGTRLVAVDISTPAAPAVVAAASVTVPSALMHLTRSSDGRFLFGDSYDELGSPFIAAFDISGGQPVLATRTALGSPVTAMNLLGQTLYTMSQDGALRLYDLAAPETGLSETGQLSLGGWAMEFAFSSDGRYLYAATGDLKVVDITVPSAPALVHTYTAAEFQRGPSFASDSRVLAHGNFLFIPGASNVGFMDVFDVIVPTAPVFRGEHVFATQDQDTSAMAASGNTLLALHGKSTVLTVRPSGSDRVAWDGRDASNATVAAGTYTVVVAAVDGSGNTASTSAAFVVNPAYATPSAVDAVAPVLSGLLARPNPFTPHLGELLLEYRADEAVNATVEIRNSSNQLVRTFPDRVANPGLVVASENSTFTGPGNGKSVRMRGGYAYYTENETLSVYDLRDLAQPVRAAALQLTPANSGGAGESVEIVGSRLFVSIGAQLAAIDISTPS
ncbi:MAG: hypothetical protein HYX59_10980, partial [Elusimicrobia bacterium]|nr:hypothetical protein [Elusimicrobiota bacterium]